MPREKDKLVNFWIKRSVYERILEKAKRQNVNLSALLRSLLIEWLGPDNAPDKEVTK